MLSVNFEDLLSFIHSVRACVYIRVHMCTCRVRRYTVGLCSLFLGHGLELRLSTSA